MDAKGAQEHTGRLIVAAARHGVVSRAELAAAGLGRGAIERAIATGRLHRLHQGVYAVGRPDITGDGLYLAAVLAMGPGAALSHRAAAAQWCLRASNSRQVEVTVPSRNGRKRRRGITVHRHAIHPWERCIHDGIPVTTPARTLIDLAEVVPAQALQRAVDRCDGLGLFDLTKVERAIAAHPRRPGAVHLRRILGEELDQTNEGLETLFLDFLRARGFPAPEIKAGLGPYEPDFLWRAQRVIAETDDWASHGRREAFEHDRERTAWLGARHFVIIPVTWRRLRRDPDGIDVDLRSALNRR